MIPHTSSQGTPQPLQHDYGASPGEIIRYEITARGFSQADLAARAGVSAKHLNQVIQGAVPLSADTALRLERTLGIPAVVLTQAAAVNQSKQQRAKIRATLVEHRAWFEQFPRAALNQLRITTARTPMEAQIEQLLEFLGVADPKAYEAVYGEAALSFRRAQRWEVNPHATVLWLRSAELKAELLEVAAYDKTGFAALLEELPALTKLPVRESFPILQARCATVGVAVVFSPGIEGARASAAVRWLGPVRPVVALTERGKHEDSLWFSFFHECGHVLLHPRRKSVIELEGEDDDDGAETDANNYAKKVLLGGRLGELMGLASRESIVAFADEVGIHPGLAAAIRAYDLDNDAWRLASKLRTKLDVAAIS